MGVPRSIIQIIERLWGHLMTIDFRRRRILCVGDVMIDHFYYGNVSRVSPEAPVPVVLLSNTKSMLGGVGNVARNIAALEAEAVIVGVRGDDANGREIAHLIRSTAGLLDACAISAGRPTVAKTRVLGNHQHIVRVDEEDSGLLDDADIAAVVARISEWAAKSDAVILSDYAKGVLGREVVAHAIETARSVGIPILVDPKRSDFSFYRGATVITPNLAELRAAARVPVDTDEAVEAAARRLMRDTEGSAILVTRSEKGMMLVEECGHFSVGTLAKEVFDVSGAGDTVIAVAALSVAAGYTLVQAVRFANAAAGVVVGKLGTATLEMEELLHAVEADDRSPERIAEKYATLPEALKAVDSWRRRGLRVGFTNGCFDILHRGHVTMLQAARFGCDRLVVAINNDDSVRRLKGSSRPVNCLADRAAVIAALQSTDLVLSFSDDTPLTIIERLLPDILFKGADYTVGTVVGADIVLAHGGEVKLLELVPGRSTTDIIARSQAKLEGTTA